ncbi:MAG: fructose-6-phosphate aldolase [Holosporaceae bacterium]|jgi:transaldolase|nr:fructose-6-phosphate aldolase [Holosporaceae bacterium]
MEIFLDTANLSDISFYQDFINGVTTNPTIMSDYPANDHKSIVRHICNLVKGHVSVEVTAENFNDMLKEGRKTAAWDSKICIKLPCTFDGLKACRRLSEEGIATNMTLCFSVAQALLAAQCGAVYVSPFIGRLDDIGQDGLALLEEISEIYSVGGYETKLLAASVRNVNHVIQSAMIGVDAITVSPKILKQCFEHHLTTKGMEIFAEDTNRNAKSN